MADVYQDGKLNALPVGDEIVTILKLQFKPGTGADVERQLRSAILATRNEPGCLQFYFFRVTSENDRYVFFERWSNKSALKSHFNQPYFQSVLKTFAENLTVPLAEIGDWTEYLQEVARDS